MDILIPKGTLLLNFLIDSTNAVKRYVAIDTRGFDPWIAYISFQPYLYVEDAELMISFDNAESFTAKGNFIAEYGLAGFAMWEAGGDFNDILLDAIRTAVGLDDC